MLSGHFGVWYPNVMASPHLVFSVMSAASKMGLKSPVKGVRRSFVMRDDEFGKTSSDLLRNARPALG